jgi:hypothetical protein
MIKWIINSNISFIYEIVANCALKIIGFRLTFIALKIFNLKFYIGRDLLLGCERKKFENHWFIIPLLYNHYNSYYISEELIKCSAEFD